MCLEILSWRKHEYDGMGKLIVLSVREEKNRMIFFLSVIFLALALFSLEE